MHDPQLLAERLATHLGLGEMLAVLQTVGGSYRLLHHWKQGEFHHDVVVEADKLPGVLVVATNCNGGIKEVQLFAAAPDRWALWNDRCPDNPEFEGELPARLGRATTVHHFDPCELLRPDARSEIKPEHRVRVRGGGWALKRES